MLSVTHAGPPTRRPAPLARTPNVLASYVLIPSRLTADMADNQTAIGLYALIARRFLVAHGPIPLSANDAQRYDPSLTRGAVVRAFARLTQAGWLLETAPPGKKSRYTPTWGVIANEPRPWDMRALQLGRPRHVPAVRLDTRLLDVYLGRVEEHPVHPARITRYLTGPLLALADIGAYTRILAGEQLVAPRLAQLGLVRNGQIQLLPDDATLLAQLSQQTLFAPSVPSLSVRGLQRLGVKQPAPTSRGQALFFAPTALIGGVIGQVIGGVIGQETGDDRSSSASGSRAAPAANERAPSTSNRTTQNDQIQPPHPPVARLGGSGGGTSANIPLQEALRPSPEAQPATPAAAALKALGVRPAVAAELASTPLSAVEAAISHGRRTPGVRDLAGWVVSLLRDTRASGWTPPACPADQPDTSSALPQHLQELAIEPALARALRAPATSVPPAEAAPCVCDGSGMYLLAVPPDHPQYQKVQTCSCRIAERLMAHLTAAAGPALARADEGSLRVEDRPYAPISWAGRAFTPAEQAATLRHALRRCVSPPDDERGACILGPPGSGKTTLAVVAAKARAMRRGLPLRYASVPKLLDDLRREAADHAPAVLLEQLIAAPLLVLDDLGREKLTPWARERLYRLLDERMRQHTAAAPRITFITANLSFAEIYALDAALGSRIAAHTDVVLCVTSDYRLHEEQGALPDGAQQ